MRVERVRPPTAPARGGVSRGASKPHVARRRRRLTIVQKLLVIATLASLCWLGIIAAVLAFS